MKKNKKIKISFQEICDRISSLKLPKFDFILGIKEGGIIPASLIALKQGLDIGFVKVSYRNGKNIPKYSSPKLSGKLIIPKKVKSILIVDDVSVTGNTINFIIEKIKNCKIKTLVLKGNANYVVFPEIRPCVHWPWEKLRNLEK